MPKTAPWKRLPEDMRGHSWNRTWTRRGQALVEEMHGFLCESMALPVELRPEIPRLVAYREIIDGGFRRLPMCDHGALYYTERNFVIVTAPTRNRKFVHMSEYSFLANSPIIGSVTTTPLNVFRIRIAHEMAHYAVDHILKPKRAAVHGRLWRMAYALLRARFAR